MPKIAIVISSPTIGSASGKPSHTPTAPTHDREAGQPVGAGVIAIRDQGRAVDLAADPDAEHGDRLVADKADDAGRRRPPKLADRLRVDQAVDRLVAGNDGAEQDDEDDQDAGQILDPPVAVGEARARLAAAPARKAIHSGIAVVGVANVVDGIGQQRDAARGEHHDSCSAAVTARMTNDHLMAQMPRSVVAIDGSMTPWVWPCRAGAHGSARADAHLVVTGMREAQPDQSGV